MKPDPNTINERACRAVGIEPVDGGWPMVAVGPRWSAVLCEAGAKAGLGWPVVIPWAPRDGQTRLFSATLMPDFRSMDGDYQPGAWSLWDHVKIPVAGELYQSEEIAIAEAYAAAGGEA